MHAHAACVPVLYRELSNNLITEVIKLLPLSAIVDGGFLFYFFTTVLQILDKSAE